MGRQLPPSRAQPERRYARDDQPRKHIPEANPALMAALMVLERLQKHWRDLAAVVLLALALITLLGLIPPITGGVLLDAWINVLRTWLGWGAFLVPLAAAWGGAMIWVRELRRGGRIHWGRVIAAEGAAFALLGLLNLFNQGSIALAMAGRGGGLIGWGISLIFARLFPPPTDALALAALFLFGLFFAVDVTADRLARLWHWLQSQKWETGGNPQRAATSPEAASPTPAPVTAREREPKLKSKLKLSAGERLRVPVETAADEVKAKTKKRDRRLPPLDLFDETDLRRPAQKEIDETASLIVKTLKEFGVPVTVVGAKVGPSVTQYQIEPGFVEKIGPDGVSRQYKVRVSQISALADDLALALSANTLRIEAPVPGQSYVGVEVPNNRTSLVSLRPVMESENFQRINSPLAIALGRDVSGAAVCADLASMPHLLIAGTTGSGKTVCLVAIVTCLAANNTPDDLRLVMIDPKMVELVRFNGLPHLYGKVETDLERILGVLRWVTREMDRRYKLFESVGARHLDHYNAKISKKKDAERLPRLVVLIDELADLMMQAPDETERTVVRLAQMARATGIHLVVATQRPSTDIVTGLIKANFPARISFAVASSVDSRVILDIPGAESLLGRGDMLFLAPEVGTPIRLQGCFVSDKEVDRLVTYWREQREEEEAEEAEEFEPAAEGKTVIDSRKPALAPWDEMLAREAVIEDKDRQIEQAIEIIKQYGTASASLLQRKMRIGYPRAARLMDELKEMGIIGREQAGGKTREVFVRRDDDPIGQRAARIIGGEGGEK